MAVLKRKHFIILLLFLLASPAFAGPARAVDSAAQSLQLYEEKIKAGLVYNFLKYTTWPADSLPKSRKDLNICLLGDDSFDGYLSPLAGRTAQQNMINVVRIGAVSESSNCSLLFVHRSQADSLPQLLSYLKGRHILTVSDIDRFAAQGGMVEFSKEEDHINLIINKSAVDSAGLTIQARLLKLAKLIPGHNG